MRITRNLSWVLMAIVFFTVQGLAQTNVPTSVTKTATAGASAFSPVGYTAGTPVNYVRTWQPRKPYTSVSGVTSETDAAKVMADTKYFDGLGRLMQSVGRKTSPDQKDIVTPVVYNELGKEIYKYLPYTSTATDGAFKTNAYAEQAGFFGSVYPAQQAAYTNESIFYGKNVYEASSLDRVQKNFAPGNAWAGSEGGTEHAVSYQYLVNTTSDSVRVWTITNNDLRYINLDSGNNIPQTAAIYAAGRLYKTVTTDEHNKQVIEYKDTDGRVLLKKVQLDASPGTAHMGWLCTYYVYDDIGRLRFVIPPKAVALLAPAGWDLTTGSYSVINELCFRYEYDDLMRMTAKKVPGAGWTYMVYDQRNRLVFTQDGKLKAAAQWLYSLYDGLNRPVETGMMSYNMRPDSLQTYVTAHTGASSANDTTYGSYTAMLPADLVVNAREPGRVYYQATSSVTVDTGFVSEDGADFLVEVTEGTFNTIVVVTSPAIPSGATRVPLTYAYYDDYTATTRSYAPDNIAKMGAGANAYAETLPATQVNQARGLPTVNRVRTIENPADLSAGKWIETVSFYDTKERVVQVNTDNYKGGQNITTNGYDFGGNVICSYLVHSAASSSLVRVKTNFDFDHAGRLLKVAKKINDADSVIIARNSYDAAGQLLRKESGQRSLTDTTALHNADYSYNIRGWLKGMNWNYAAASGPTTSQVNTTAGKWFAMDLAYDWGFDTLQYNGNIAGQRWVSGGDGKERSFGYGYDAANRLLYASFKQKFGSGWSNLDPDADFTIDYSVKMGDGATPGSAYDGNGNILSMQQKGLKLNASPLIDNLTYTYASNSNKLSAVTDAVTADNKLSDFTDGNTSGDDYGYDVNGNLLKDRNKNIGSNDSTGIFYNHLNLPDSVRVRGKGYIKYVYDATGNKLEKRTKDSATGVITRTDYLNGFIYQNDTLQYFTQEEGRVRKNLSVTTSHPNNFHFDYFIKDHLGNTRAVLTDEIDTSRYPTATLENADTAVESQYYTIVNGRIKDVSLITGYGTAINTDASNHKMYELRATTGDKTGLGITLRVMTGDEVLISGRSYWHGSAVPDNNHPLNPDDIITAMAGTGIVAQNTHNGVTGSSIVTAGITPGDIDDFLSNNAPAATTTPKAYINWILFDEQFRVVSSSSGFSKVGGSDTLKTHVIPEVSIAKNGYLYVYCSNESDSSVFFDNLKVVHLRGPLLEETHYYPFGLTMAGISSKAAGKLENRFKYNGGNELQSKEFSDGSGLELYDAHFRMYDAQIGRFGSVDKLANLFESSSPYVFANNNPILINDPLGLAGDTIFESKKPLPEHVGAPASKRSAIGETMYPALWMNLDYFKGQEWSIANSNLRPGEMAGRWLVQTGPANLVFPQNHYMTQGMKNAWKVNNAREFFYKKYLNRFLTKNLHGGRINYDGSVAVTNYRGDFGLTGLAMAGFDAAEQYVGSYGINIYLTADDQQLVFVLSNTTSMDSFLYGIGPEYERRAGTAGGNTRQLYIWSEPLDFNKYNRVEDAKKYNRYNY